jgi:hypothetical protein
MIMIGPTCENEVKGREKERRRQKKEKRNDARKGKYRLVMDKLKESETTMQCEYPKYAEM